MKSAKYIILGALALTMAACEKDFFETNSPSAMDNSVFKATSTTEQAIGGIYNIFGEDKSFRNRLCGGYVGMNTDIEYINKGSGQAFTAATYQLDKGTGDLSATGGKDPWGYLTTAIERSNAVITGIRTYSDLKNKDFQYLLGEALCLRSFCYLEMVKLWGDVPASFDPFTGEKIDDLYVKKSDRNVIFEQLRADLKEASELMPWSSACPGDAHNNTGRPSKAFALALLARVDMMYAGYAMRPDQFTEGGTTACSVQFNVKDASKRQELYQEVAGACAKIIKEELMPLSSFATSYPYEQTFRSLCGDETSYANSEYIWCIPFMDRTRGQFLCINGLKMDASCAGKLINTEDGDTKTIQTKVQGMVRIVPTFIFDFEDGDVRRDVTVCPFGWSYDNGQSGAGKDPSIFPDHKLSDKKLYQKVTPIHQMNLGKYRVEWMRNKYNLNDDGVDMPIIRYADVLLMYAEAVIGSKEGAAVAATEVDGISAKEAFDVVRTRAGLASKPLTIDNIIAERAFEFCGEGIRKYDLMRWGILGATLEKTKSRLADLEAATGEFAGRLDSIYFTYKAVDGLTQSGEKAYAFDKVYGLRKGDVRPAEFDKTAGWVVKSLYAKESDGTVTRYLDPSTYYLYKVGYTANDIDRHQYWPIFNLNIDASRGTLWNDYDY